LRALHLISVALGGGRAARFLPGWAKLSQLTALTLRSCEVNHTSAFPALAALLSALPQLLALDVAGNTCAPRSGPDSKGRFAEALAPALCELTRLRELRIGRNQMGLACARLRLLCSSCLRSRACAASTMRWATPGQRRSAPRWRTPRSSASSAPAATCSAAVASRHSSRRSHRCAASRFWTCATAMPRAASGMCGAWEPGWQLSGSFRRWEWTRYATSRHSSSAWRPRQRAQVTSLPRSLLAPLAALRVLGIGNCELGVAGLRELAAAAAALPALTRLQLSGNNLSAAGADALEPLFAWRAAPLCLEVHNVGLEDSGALALAAAAAACPAEFTIRLGSNAIGDSGRRALAAHAVCDWVSVFGMGSDELPGSEDDADEC
jgi:Leucine Rich repeat